MSHLLGRKQAQLTLTVDSFAATGAISVVIAWFILPEVARRTPAEIDELYALHFPPLQFDYLGS